MAVNEKAGRGGASSGTVAALVGMRDAAADAGDDHELCIADLGLFGLSGADALGELLALHAGVPIVIPASGSWRKSETSVVRSIVRRPASIEEFRATVRRLRRTSGSMYLRLEC